jgi:hypothetical protein
MQQVYVYINLFEQPCETSPRQDSLLEAVESHIHKENRPDINSEIKILTLRISGSIRFLNRSITCKYLFSDMSSLRGELVSDLVLKLTGR